jgi:hypothetical protein
MVETTTGVPMSAEFSIKENVNVMFRKLSVNFYSPTDERSIWCEISFLSIRHVENLNSLFCF